MVGDEPVDPMTIVYEYSTDRPDQVHCRVGSWMAPHVLPRVAWRVTQDGFRGRLTPSTPDFGEDVASSVDIRVELE
jgi:hypothetical protein